MSELPFCRHRGPQLGSRWVCNSTRLVVGHRGVGGEVCRSCPFPDHDAAPLVGPVSACLLSWKRPGNLQKIVDNLERHDFIDEVLVWNNNPDVRLSLHGRNVRVIDSREKICYGRYLCAAEARHETIYVQDDDVLVHNVPAIYREFLADPSRITFALDEPHFRMRDRYRYPASTKALVGFGAFFKKEWIQVLAPCKAAYGTDPLFLREADKLFTMLLGRHHNPQPGQLQFLADRDTRGIALYRDDRHVLCGALAVRRALELRRLQTAPAGPVTWNVVIPCHNYGRFLTDAIESVLRSDADYVLNVVDDASEDDTRRVAQSFAAQYPHVRLIALDRRAGVSRARNLGVAASASEFVVLLDADDRIGPDYLFAAERLLRTPCDVASPDAVSFGLSRKRWWVPDRPTFADLLRTNGVSTCAAFRRRFWEEVGGFDEGLEAWEDYDFWLRLAKAGARIQRLPGDHFHYRKHGPSRTSLVNEPRAALRDWIRQKHRPGGAPVPAS